jgi:hypothetical protein
VCERLRRPLRTRGIRHGLFTFRPPVPPVFRSAPGLASFVRRIPP